ncbi:MAG: ABC transporter substrate-binding protein [Gemmatimonadota bacterium]|nr:MAG: ABC transporter substrate-binding protein [Gemmatimonadota bacterium]
MKRYRWLTGLVLSLVLAGVLFSANAQSYQEAPMLAEMVAAGELPPVDERLPANPMVIEPFEQIGQYGGTLRRALRGPSDGNGWRTIATEALFEWDFGRAVAIPSLAASISANADSTVHTLKLREGLKWSDGHPFTADDLVFFYEAVLLSPDVVGSAVGVDWKRVAGVQTEIVKVDDTTVEFRFGAPYALLEQGLAYHGDTALAPKHYLSQFHADFVPEDELQARVEEAGVDNWAQLFIQKNSVYLNPDRPVMGPWKVEVAFPADQMVAVRNPYYWKVDTEGNQLPYIDRIVTDLIQDAEAITLRASAGDIDFQYRHIRFSDLPLLAEGAETNGYQVLRWSDTTGWFSLYMNQSHADPVMRELMQNVDFRAGLSHAIDRETMNELLYLGTGEISHPAGLAGDPYFEDGFGQRFLEYDAGLANELLDKAGVAERDASGFRLRPDGERLTLTISTYPFETGASSVDAYELVAQYWEDVGVQTIVDLKERGLWTNFVTSNQHDIAGYLTASVLWNLNPTWYVPTASNTYWAPLFGEYYASGGSAGEEPPELFKRLQTLYDDLTTTLDPEANLELGREILRAHDENVFMIGTVKVPFQPVIVNSDLVNVLDQGVADFRLRHEGQSKFYQLSFQNP